MFSMFSQEGKRVKKNKRNKRHLQTSVGNNDRCSAQFYIHKFVVNFVQSLAHAITMVTRERIPVGNNHGCSVSVGANLRVRPMMSAQPHEVVGQSRAVARVDLQNCNGTQACPRVVTAGMCVPYISSARQHYKITALAIHRKSRHFTTIKETTSCTE